VRSGESIAIKAGTIQAAADKAAGGGAGRGGGHTIDGTRRGAVGRGARAENKNSASKEGCQGVRTSQRASGSSGVARGSAGSRSAGGIAAVYLTRPTEIPFHLGARRRASLSNDATPVALSLSLSLSLCLSLFLHIYIYIYIYIYPSPCCGISPRHASSRVDSYLCRSRRTSARLIRASIGPRLAEISCGALGSIMDTTLSLSLFLPHIQPS